MRFLILVSLLFFFASCKSDAPSEGSSLADETSAPVPGVKLTPTVSGSEAITPTNLDGYPDEYIKECDCSLQLDSATDDELFFVFNWKKGPGVISLNGEQIVLERGASLTSANAGDGYLHQNARYRVQTSLFSEGNAGSEGEAQSGKVTITNSASGEKTVVRVKGVCSC